MRIKSVLAALALSPLAVSVVHADQLSDVMSKKSLSCGVYADVPPFSAPDPQTRELVGMDVDLCKALAKHMGVELELKPLSVEARIPEVKMGRVDVIFANLAYTKSRADQIQWKAGKAPGDEGYIDYFAPIVADAEAGFGGVLNAYELMKSMIEAGAAGVHFEDQLASVKKCGHMGGKVLVPTQEAIQKLVAARLAADVAGVPTIILARTDANAADLLTSDCDPYDKPFVTGERTHEGFYKVRAGLDQAIARGLAYAPYADLIWCETARPDLDEARRFAEAIKKEYPDQLLSYNCSPSFNWKKNLDDATIAKFQRELSAMGYKHQFITLAGIHNMWHSMFNLAHDYARNDMTAYVKLQEQEFADAAKGYTFVAHQQEVGTGYFDDMTTVIQGGVSSVTALTGSTEEEQFH
ncbi:isocitrate lyase [Pseudomonas syringae]|uniref:isocitrate lyase n=1 Tax=Pseudomonas syringae TaxID=317 RepID=UPI000F3CD5EB|nr:isocitrate lyase [Pseudomonas syringae]RMN78509.1 Isocitrate lyase [Pseudomonas syringae pv. papulans]